MYIDSLAGPDPILCFRYCATPPCGGKGLVVFLYSLFTIGETGPSRELGKTIKFLAVEENQPYKQPPITLKTSVVWVCVDASP